jgi:transposase-like protein
MKKISFKRHRFLPEAIRHAILLYARFTLSYRDVEDLLVERGTRARARGNLRKNDATLLSAVG